MLLSRYYLGSNEVKQDEVIRTYSMHGGEEKCFWCAGGGMLRQEAMWSSVRRLVSHTRVTDISA